MGTNLNREPVFKFKQFEVRDAVGAMKVGTDGVLLGAWAPVAGARRAIDVGTGSGVIALMLAQRGVEHITAIEIDADAAEEARQNAARSPWADRIEVAAGDATVMDYGACAPDLIVSNPPFFNESLKSPDSARRAVRHEGSLGFESLIELGARWLGDGGVLAFVSPSVREAEIEFAATLNRMSVLKKTYVRTVPGKSAKRILWALGKRVSVAHVDVLTIRTDGQEYTDEYAALTAPFYLNL